MISYATEKDESITLKRIHTTHCQVCGEPFIHRNLSNVYLYPLSAIVYFVPLDNNICCQKCAEYSHFPYEPRIYREGK